MPTPDDFARSAFGEDDPDAVDRLLDAIADRQLVPRALTMARECRAVLDVDRTGRVTTTVVTPSPHRPHELYDAAASETTDEDDAGELYRHALVEAGMIVDDQHRPVDPCPVCGWKAP
jgi:hypothetical protein